METLTTLENYYFILIIEDNEENLEFLKTILDKKSYNVIPASTVDNALEALHSISIDLVVTDYYLGYQTADIIIQEAKKEQPDMPIIVTSGSVDIKKELLGKGVSYFLSKPFFSWEIQAMVDNLLHFTSAKKELNNASLVINALSKSIGLKDPYTEGHAQSVADLSLGIYKEVEYYLEDEANDLYAGCMLHDIGKIGLPDNILKSPKSPPSKKERKEIEKHPRMGWNICQDLHGFGDSLDIIIHHHEKLDGSGYPDGIEENKILRLTKIATVADIYDALTSDRSYRTRMDQKKAFRILDEEARLHRITKEYIEALKKIKNFVDRRFF